MSCQSIGFSSVLDAWRPAVFQLQRPPTLNMFRDCGADMVTISRASAVPFSLAPGAHARDNGG